MSAMMCDFPKEMMVYLSGTLVGRLSRETKYFYEERNLESSSWKQRITLDLNDGMQGKSSLSEMHKAFLNPSRVVEVLETLRCNNIKECSTELAVGELVYRRRNESVCTKYNADIFCDMGDVTPAVDLIFYQEKLIGLIMVNFETTIFVVPGYESHTPLIDWDVSTVSTRGHGVMKYGSFPVRMRDGVHLVTDVYLPADYKKGEKLPAVLMRTPYQRELMNISQQVICDKGYAFISQDIRGSGESEGSFPALYDEDLDVEDTLEWLIQQPFSDGKVGTQGKSYAGYWQIQGMLTKKHSLGCTIPMVPAFSMFHSFWRKNGSFNWAVFPWMCGCASRKNPFTGGLKYDYKNLLNERPLSEAANKVLGFTPEIFAYMMEHPDRDEAWLKDRCEERLVGNTVPAFCVEGLYDSENNGGRMLWQTLQKNNHPNRKMVLGPWAHWFNGRRTLGDVTYGVNATVYNLELQYLKWYDRFLKGYENGIENTIVSYYVCGSDIWRASQCFPPEQSERVVGYLVEDKIQKEPGNQITKRDYLSDPEKNLDYCTGGIFSPNLMPTVTKRLKDQERLVYTSAPFAEAKEVVCYPQVRIFASTTAEDMDLFVRLFILKANGTEIRLIDQLAVARYREGFDKAKVIKPGEICKFEIELPAISQLFEKGDSIRVEVSSCVPESYVPNLQTKENIFTQVKGCSGVNTVYGGGKYDSCVILYLKKEVDKL